MKSTYQYRFYPDTKQKLRLNLWLRTCRYWYNRQLGDRFDWWEMNRCYVDRCSLESCSIATLRDKPSYFSQKKELPVIKQDLVKVRHSGELLDFKDVDSTILQEVSKRAEKAFDRFIAGDGNGKKSGRPRFKTQADFKTMTFATASNDWLKIEGQKWLQIRLPKIGIVKVRKHRAIPEGFKVKQISVTLKADGWYMNIMLENKDGVAFTDPECVPTWDNSLGLDAVLHADVYLATSEGEKLPSLKPLRKNQVRLDKISTKRNKRKRGSKARKKLAKREAKQHQRIARSRKDHHYNTAHAVVKTGKKFIFHEDLNLAGLTKRNKVKQAEDGTFLPNGQASKSGLNKSWNDAAFGNFFKTLEYIAEKAGSVVIAKNPAYSSQVLSYRDKIIFTDCSMRGYWDEQESLMVDRDVNAAINLKRLGLGIFPSIKRRSGKTLVIGNMTHSTMKETLWILQKTEDAYAVPERSA